jgi:hypothetical protein
MPGVSSAPTMQTFYDGWANYERLLLTAIRKLTPEQLALRPAPRLWTVWQLAGHVGRISGLLVPRRPRRG